MKPLSTSVLGLLQAEEILTLTNNVVFCVSRVDLIDSSIEKAVAMMQSVIELGRYIRDVKVMPTKVRT